MALCGTIFRTHYGDANTRGSLGSLIALFRRKNLTKDSLNFKAADELLRIVFEALLLVLVDFFESHIDTLDELVIPRVTDIIIDTIANLGSLMESHPSMILGRPCTAADINALLLLRDVAVYIELGDAIKTGDIGRIRSILPTITLMMHGGGNTNYARIQHELGVPQILRLHQHQSLQEIARMFERAVGAKYHNPAHVRSSSKGDIYKVKKAFQESGILTWEPSDDKRALPDLVVDLQHEGVDKMASGALDKFLTSKIDHHGAADLEETEAVALTEHAD
ncbi:hypothetical protein BGZ95_009164 [Linnemannia exigua]|uniref:DUF6589 domain-containing protein n=1 Tax=Linnemannia exigua TaxID=604196 RepID=A0AAD4H7B4_9FUNG|nr:hypothetical protein BGZ95_009164 [Linnemannia exigua]